MRGGDLVEEEEEEDVLGFNLMEEFRDLTEESWGFNLIQIRYLICVHTTSQQSVMMTNN